MDTREYNIFISWSGSISRNLAIAVYDFLPVVIQAAHPFISSKEIEAGARGLTEIASQLNHLKLGIFCVTGDNQASPWLNFEAGAISKLLDESYVVPLLFRLEPGQVTQPLAQFQAMKFTK